MMNHTNYRYIYMYIRRVKRIILNSDCRQDIILNRKVELFVCCFVSLTQ